jgi:cholestenol Delta-isomerase
MSRLLNGFWNSPPVAKMAPLSAHPYYPLDAHVPGYEANGRHVMELLTLFALGCSAIFAVTWFVLGKTSPRLPMKEKMTVLWFILSM